MFGQARNHCQQKCWFGRQCLEWVVWLLLFWGLRGICKIWCQSNREANTGLLLTMLIVSSSYFLWRGVICDCQWWLVGLGQKKQRESLLSQPHAFGQESACPAWVQAPACFQGANPTTSSPKSSRIPLLILRPLLTNINFNAFTWSFFWWEGNFHNSFNGRICRAGKNKV